MNRSFLILLALGACQTPALDGQRSVSIAYPTNGALLAEPDIDVVVEWAGADDTVQLLVHGIVVAEGPTTGGTATFPIDLSLWSETEIAVELVARATGQESEPVEVKIDARAVGLADLASVSLVTPIITMTDGVPTAMYFELPAASDDPLEAALLHLSAYPEVYGIRNPDTALRLSDVDYDGSLRRLRFDQYVSGVRVIGATLSVLHERDTIVGTTGNYLPDPDLVLTSARIYGDDAQQIAVDAAGADVATQLALPELAWFVPMLFAMEGEPRLVWEVNFLGQPGTMDEAAWTVRVDAINGDVVTLQDGTADTGPDIDIIDTGGSDPLVNTFCLGGTDGIDACDEDGCIAGASDDAMEAWSENLATRQYYLNQFGWNSWDNDCEQIESVVNFLHDSPNATANNYCKQTRFDPGFATDDIITHEYTHQVVFHTADFEYIDNTQCAALHEHYGDVMSVLQRYRATNALNWTYSPGISSRTFGVDGTLSMPIPSGTGQHRMSGLPSAVFRTAWEGGTFGGANLIGVAPDKLEQVWFHVLRVEAGPSTSFMPFRNNIVGRAAAWAETGTHGFTDQDVCDLTNAFASAGLGTFTDACGLLDVDGDYVKDVMDNCVNVANTYQQDMDGDGIGDACDVDTDGDGLDNVVDPCPVSPEPALVSDLDGDGIGDHCDDSDADSVIDAIDLCPFDPDADNLDNDGDLLGDVCDDNDDNDDALDVDDTCPLLADTDHTDVDGDGLGPACDNCPTVDNADQLNRDSASDGGDACDPDDDNDGVLDESDNCPGVSNPSQSDGNGDGIGFACDAAAQQTDLPMGMQFTVPAQNGMAYLSIPTCAGACPNWLDDGFTTRLELESSMELAVAVVDSDHRFLTKASSDEAFSTGGLFGHSLDFHPEAGASYTAPGADEASSSTAYFLVLQASDPGATSVDVWVSASQ